MGKKEPEPKAKTKTKAEALPEEAASPPPNVDPEPEPPKPKATLKEVQGWRDDFASIMGELDEVDTSDDPYLTDAKAFALQAQVMLEKQIVAEGGDLPTKPATNQK